MITSIKTKENTYSVSNISLTNIGCPHGSFKVEFQVKSGKEFIDCDEIGLQEKYYFVNPNKKYSQADLTERFGELIISFVKENYI